MTATGTRSSSAKASVATAGSFLELLKKSNLLSSKQIAHLRAGSLQVYDADPKLLADALVAKGLLTPWQSAQLLAGRHAFFLGKYKLLDRIGAGGMGQVFKAQHAMIGHIVALKVVSKQRLSQPGAIARFNREIQAAGALQHPNIISSYDADKVGDTHFLVMEFVDGQDLTCWLKEYGPLPIDLSCECIRQAALGLQHAHEKGMVHRDIKPGNLLMTRDPETGLPIVKLLDMGLARFVSEGKGDGDITQTGQILGTPDYIAPEQARDTKNADIRADIFSLGCTLFRILTGRLPYEGDNPVEKLVARYTQDATPIRDVRSDIPPALAAVVAKMMARDPAQRYKTPNLVAAALAPFSLQLASAGQAIQPTPSGESSIDSPGSSTGDFLNLLASFRAAGETETPHVPGDTIDTGPRKVKKFNPRAGNIAAIQRALTAQSKWTKAAMACVALVLFLVLVMIGKDKWEIAGRTTLRITWPPAERDAGQLTIDGRPVPLLSSGLIEHQAPPGPRRVVLQRPGYEPFVFQETIPRGDSRTIVARWLPTAETRLRLEREAAARQREQQFQNLEQQAHKLLIGQITAGETQAIRSSLESFLKRWPETAESREAAQLLSRFPLPLDHLDVNQLPEELLPLVEQVPVLVGVFGATHDERLAHRNPLICVAYSGDGTRLATASRDEVKIWDTATNQLVVSLPEELRTTAVTFSPDGKTLATLGYQAKGPALNLWDAATGRLRFALNPPASQPYRMAFQPSSQGVLVVGNVDGTLQLWDANTGQPGRSIKAHERTISDMAFSGDGLRLATSALLRQVPNQPAQFEPVKIWDLATGNVVTTLEEKTASATALALNADGKRLAVADSSASQIRIWDVARRELHLTIESESSIQELAFTPDGQALAGSSSQARTIRLWDAETAEPRTGVSGANGYIHSFAFGPGHTLAYTSVGSLRLRLHDWQEGRESFGNEGHQNAVTSLSFSPDGGTLASVGVDQRLILWDTATGQPRPPLTEILSPHAALFSPDGKTLAVVTGDRNLYLLDSRTGAVRKQLTGMFTISNFAPAWSFSPDSQKIAVAWMENSIKLFGTLSGTELKTVRRANMVSGLAIHPDGARLAVAEFNSPIISQLNLGTWAEVDRLDSQQQMILSLSYSVDGRRLASTGQDGTVKLWDLSSKAAVLEDPALSFSFSSDRRTLATSDGQAVLRLWDLRYNTPIIEYSLPQYAQVVNGQQVPIRSVHQILFSPDGRYLATANANGTIFVLRLHDVLDPVAK